MTDKILVIRDPGKSHALLDKFIKDVVDISSDMLEYAELTPDTMARLVDEEITAMVVGKDYSKSLLDISKFVENCGLVFNYGSSKVIPIAPGEFIQRNPDKMKKFAEDILTAYWTFTGTSPKEVSSSTQYQIIRSEEEMEILVKDIERMGVVSYDFETSKLDSRWVFSPTFKIYSVAFSFNHGFGYVVINPERFLDYICRIFGNPRVIKVAQNAKFDMHCAYHLGIRQFRGPFHDTMSMHHIIDHLSRHNLESMVSTYLYRYDGYKSTVDYDWDSTNEEELAQYNVTDADMTLRLWDLFCMILAEDERLLNLYRNLVAPAMKVLFETERTGMLVDIQKLVEGTEECEKIITTHTEFLRAHPVVQKYETVRRQEIVKEQCAELEAKITKIEAKQNPTKADKSRLQGYDWDRTNLLAGIKSVDYEFNFGSPKQLSELLYSKDGFDFDVPKLIKDDSDLHTGKNILEALNDRSGFVEHLLILRQAKHLKSTYFDGLTERLDYMNKIHSTFNQHITLTGRLSSSNPNLQNIITRTRFEDIEKLVKAVKKCFVVPDGYVMLQADYSQAELRIVASYAGEQNMLNAYNTGKDLHEVTAAKIQRITLEQFQAQDEKARKRQRYEAKSANFGLIYGMSAMGYQEYAKTNYGVIMSKAEAERTRIQFFKTYPSLLTYHEEYINKARKFGYVRTFFGRRVVLPEINHYDGGIRGHAERNAINSPIQGTAGEVTILALILLRLRLDPRVLIINTIHDSIIFLIPLDLLEVSKPIIKETMENLPMKLYFGKSLNNITMKIDMEESTKSWGDLKG
jgi:DNA polymerase I